jgi:hypothetical protein
MFLQEDDMGTVIYDYQVEQIADGDDTAMPSAIMAAVEEAQSYLSPNDRKEWQDGRPKYDVEKIFNTTAEGRNYLILQHCKTLAKFHFINLCNADILYERAQKNYDRAVSYLKDLGRGNVTLKSLPLIEETPEIEIVDEILPYRSGSRKKFNHE